MNVGMMNGILLNFKKPFPKRLFLGLYEKILYQIITVIYILAAKIVSEYDQEIPQSQTADNPVARQGRAAQP